MGCSGSSRRISRGFASDGSRSHKVPSSLESGAPFLAVNHISSMRAPRLNRVITPRRVSTVSLQRVATATSSTDGPAATELFDVFDPPYRPGESSTPPRLSSSRPAVEPERPETIPPLPEPILYDGRAQGRNSRSMGARARALPTSLPPPTIFDGPAKPGCYEPQRPPTRQGDGD
ncbi:hypothetical protein BC826DRAFT_1029348 [Russula brevipes]|nr:hypothetical protein BC826DRAFT_1029348 [Russula brevipes]